MGSEWWSSITRRSHHFLNKIYKIQVYFCISDYLGRNLAYFPKNSETSKLSFSKIRFLEKKISSILKFVKRGGKNTRTYQWIRWNRPLWDFPGFSSLNGISWTVIAIKRFVLLWKESKAASTKVTKAEVRAPWYLRRNVSSKCPVLVSTGAVQCLFSVFFFFNFTTFLKWRPFVWRFRQIWL
jgi:hypothetical protein